MVDHSPPLVHKFYLILPFFASQFQIGVDQLEVAGSQMDGKQMFIAAAAAAVGMLLLESGPLLIILITID